MLASDVATRPATFRISRRFGAPADKIFRAWTDPAELALWWCPPGWTPAEMLVELRAGGAFRLGMRKIGSAQVVYSHGRFIEVRAPRHIVYTWNWEGAFPEMPETRVTVDFAAHDGGTEVTLVHEALPGIPLCLRHRSGWLDALGRLGDVVSHQSRDSRSC